jgi:hypothetical protein
MYNYITTHSVKPTEFDKGVCVSKTATHFDLRHVSLKVTTIVVTHSEEDNTQH